VHSSRSTSLVGFRRLSSHFVYRPYRTFPLDPSHLFCVCFGVSCTHQTASIVIICGAHREGLFKGVFRLFGLSIHFRPSPLRFYHFTHYPSPFPTSQFHRLHHDDLYADLKPEIHAAIRPEKSPLAPTIFRRFSASIRSA
jgi:hypothetical protein